MKLINFLNNLIKYDGFILIDSNFNKFVIDKSVIDIFDFFKIKKFVKETSLEF